MPNKPIVPSYNVYIDFPKGYPIQDVTLDKRGGLSTDTGLNLPDAVPGIDGAVSNIQQAPEADDWWPDQDFAWSTVLHPDGSRTLIITIYPFTYHRPTTNVRFYRDYIFDIHYAKPDVALTELKTDKIAYEQGQRIVADMHLFNASSTPLDLIVDARINSDTSGELIP